jgi:hypothetical protein
METCGLSSIAGDFCAFVRIVTRERSSCEAKPRAGSEATHIPCAHPKRSNLGFIVIPVVSSPASRGGPLDYHENHSRNQ